MKLRPWIVDWGEEQKSGAGMNTDGMSMRNRVL
jgi:hypothetical protein